MILALRDEREVTVSDMDDSGDVPESSFSTPRTNTKLQVAGVHEVSGHTHLFSHRATPELWADPVTVSAWGHPGAWRITIAWAVPLEGHTDHVHAHCRQVVADLGGSVLSIHTEAIEPGAEVLQDMDLTYEDAAADQLEDDHEGIVDPRIAALLPTLVADPEFDPIRHDDEMEEFVRSRLALDENDDFVSDLVLELYNYAKRSGLDDAAERDLREQARKILAFMPASLRDELGFASRNARKEEIIDPLIENSLQGLRRGRQETHVLWLEQELYAAERESRYATAARRLIGQGRTKKSVSQALGISTSVIDRLLRTRHQDVEIKEGDPLQDALRG
jgi:hypothetical protein